MAHSGTGFSFGTFGSSGHGLAGHSGYGTGAAAAPGTGAAAAAAPGTGFGFSGYGTGAAAAAAPGTGAAAQGQAQIPMVTSYQVSLDDFKTQLQAEYSDQNFSADQGFITNALGLYDNDFVRPTKGQYDSITSIDPTNEMDKENIISAMENRPILPAPGYISNIAGQTLDDQIHMLTTEVNNIIEHFLRTYINVNYDSENTIFFNNFSRTITANLDSKVRNKQNRPPAPLLTPDENKNIRNFNPYFVKLKKK